MSREVIRTFEERYQNKDLILTITELIRGKTKRTTPPYSEEQKDL